MSVWTSLRKHALFTLTVAGVIAGVILGFIFRPYLQSEKSGLVLRLVNFPGEIFLRGIKFIIIPLLSSSLILGIGGNSVNKTGAIARRTLLFFFVTTLLAVVLAVALVIIIQPGRLNRGRIEFDESKNITIGASVEEVNTVQPPKLSTWDTFMDVARNLIPDNIVEMCFQVYRSKLDVNYTTTLNQNETLVEYKVIAGYHRGVNILGLALFSITIGIILSEMGHRGRPMIKFIEIINEISIRLISLFMWFSPIGVCSLVCITIIQMQDPANIFIRLLFYFLTMLFGYSIHGFIVLPTLMYLITRKNVLVFIEEMAEVFLISFATASSSATLPTTIRCVEENAKLPKIVSRVVLPCGIIVNKDGTAFYYVVASTFLAQLNLIELGFIDLVINATVALVLSCGGSGTPGAHMTNTILLLSLLHIPIDQISLLIAIDWIIDRFMTVINCWSDCVCCAIVAHLSRNEIVEEAKEERVEEEGENDVFVNESTKI